MKGRPPRLFDFHGKPLTIRQLAALAGCSFLTMHKRLKTKTAAEAVAMGQADPSRKTMPAKRSTEPFEQRLARYMAKHPGYTWREFGKHFRPDQRDDAFAAMERMRAAGEVYAEQLTLPRGLPAVRYWPSAEAAAQWKVDNAARLTASGAAIQENRERLKKRALVQKTKPLPVKRQPVKQPPKHSQARVDAQQAADYSRAVVQQCPSSLDQRFTFHGTPGRHVDAGECRPWARQIGG